MQPDEKDPKVVPLKRVGPKRGIEDPDDDIQPHHVYPHAKDARIKGEGAATRFSVGKQLWVPTWTAVFYQESVIDDPRVPLYNGTQVTRDALIHRASGLRGLGYDHPEWAGFMRQAKMQRIAWREETDFSRYRESVQHLISAQRYRLLARTEIIQLVEEEAQDLPNGLQKKLLRKVDDARNGRPVMFDPDDMEG